MNEDKLTIFLSHSHKDVEKVRKIRDILEILNCEPLIFFMKCLDDNNVELEDFIKREIEARNIFLYCKSENSEQSKWVQKELAYIKSIDESRFYEIDIEKDFKYGMIDLIKSIADMIKRNRIFISCSVKDFHVQKKLADYLQERGFNVFDLKKDVEFDFINVGDEIIRTSQEGVFVYLCSENSLNRRFANMELNKALACGAKIVPVMIKGAEESQNIPLIIKTIRWVIIDENPTSDQLKNLYKAITS